jgi:hypothetical protein
MILGTKRVLSQFRAKDPAWEKHRVMYDTAVRKRKD